MPPQTSSRGKKFLLALRIEFQIDKHYVSRH